MVCLWNIWVITLHKGDSIFTNDDDDDDDADDNNNNNNNNAYSVYSVYCKSIVLVLCYPN
jgi:hypothetical protein